MKRTPTLSMIAAAVSIGLSAPVLAESNLASAASGSVSEPSGPMFMNEDLAMSAGQYLSSAERGHFGNYSSNDTYSSSNRHTGSRYDRYSSSQHSSGNYAASTPERSGDVYASSDGTYSSDATASAGGASPEAYGGSGSSTEYHAAPARRTWWNPLTWFHGHRVHNASRSNVYSNEDAFRGAAHSFAPVTLAAEASGSKSDPSGPHSTVLSDEFFRYADRNGDQLLTNDEFARMGWYGPAGNPNQPLAQSDSGTYREERADVNPSGFDTTTNSSMNDSTSAMPMEGTDTTQADVRSSLSEPNPVFNETQSFNESYSSDVPSISEAQTERTYTSMTDTQAWMPDNSSTQFQASSDVAASTDRSYSEAGSSTSEPGVQSGASSEADGTTGSGS